MGNIKEIEIIEKAYAAKQARNRSNSDQMIPSITGIPSAKGILEWKGISWIKACDIIFFFT